MAQSPIKLLTDTWVPATWNDYIQAVEDPNYVKAKSYYHDGKLRIEMVPIGNDHASDHTVVLPGLTISLLNEALRRSHQSNHGQVSAWLLAQFQQ
jgi:hypothetical protein